MLSAKALYALCAVLLFSSARGSSLAQGEKTGVLGANPIRKVVTLMQNMQKEIEAEGAKEKELFDKFMCYCQNNSGDLAKSVADAKQKAGELAAKLKAETAEKSTNEQELSDHKSDREAAIKDLADATAIREKENAEFKATDADMKTNLKAMDSAIPALEKGMGASSFLQTAGGEVLGQMVDSFAFTDENDRSTLSAFLQSGLGEAGDYVPQSGQIVGILKQMKDTVEANIAEATKSEEGAVAAFTALKASKEQEITTASMAIENKQVRAGTLAVSVVETKDDLEDTEKEAADTEKFGAQLQAQCGTKEKEWAEREKLRAEEITAISEAISILNDDDALDVFKKAVPAALAQQQVGFLQRSGSHTQATSLRKAQAILEHVAARTSHKSLMKLMLFTLSSKLKHHAKHKTTFTAMKFDEVTKMVDDMVEIEGKEQAEDDTEKPWCNGEFDKAAKEEGAEKSEIASLEATIAEEDDETADLDEEIKTLNAEILALDTAVVEATEQRKEEHEDYAEGLRLSSTAMTLVEKAKNRMNKFYNPVLYKAAPIKEMTMEEKILASGGGAFAQLTQHDGRVAPPPPPETFGEYKKSGEKSSGVISLMDEILKELKNDMADAEFEEKNAQKDYEELMSESKTTRTEKTKGITNKEAAKAQIGEKKEVNKVKEKADEEDVEHIQDKVDNLHKDCDFILENYDTRKEARAQEVEGLKKAKAVLAGAIM